ncbi:MAG: anti-sigma factor antagonist [Chloroflexi bacterium]|nr:MAG: anti-sigma factor antagonist [Chloroflexota bacterium]
MEYQIHTDGSINIVELAGDLDVSGAPALQEALQQIIDNGGQQVVVNLGEVPFMDSSGLGVLVAAYRRMAAVGGQIALASPRPTLQKVFKLTRTDRLFKTFDQVNDAVAHMRDM